MKKPLNYMILKQFIDKDNLSAIDILIELKYDFAKRRDFSIDSICHALMTASENGLISEIDKKFIDDKLYFIYSANKKQREFLRKYIL